MSPLYVSVHATDPAVRCKMMNNRFAGELMDRLQRLFDAGIHIHCQGTHEAGLIGSYLPGSCVDVW